MIQPERPPYESHLIRPSVGTYLRYARNAGVPFLALGLYGLVRMATNPHAPQLLGYLFTIITPIYLAVFLHLRLARVTWDDRRICTRGLLGKRTIERAEIQGIAFRSVSPALSVQSYEKLVVYGRGKHILLVLWGAFWSKEDLRAFAFAISPTSADTSMLGVSQREFNREYPHGGSFFARHPNLSGIAGSFFILLLICLSIAATER